MLRGAGSSWPRWAVDKQVFVSQGNKAGRSIIQGHGKIAQGRGHQVSPEGLLSQDQKSAQAGEEQHSVVELARASYKETKRSKNSFNVLVSYFHAGQVTRLLW